MYKKTLTDGTRRWFDAAKADELGQIAEDQHEEKINYTTKGMFVIEKETYGIKEERECTEVTPKEAVAFLMDNGFEVPEWLEHLTGDEV